MLQIHSATLQIARQENCLPARPFLPFSPSRRLSVSAVRPPRPDASKVNAEDRPITGSPFHSMKYRYPSPASRRWMGRTRSNIRQKQRRPSLPCSYFPFLSTRQPARPPWARAAGRSLSEGKNTPKFRHGSSVILPPPSILKHGYDTTSSREYAMAKVHKCSEH